MKRFSVVALALVFLFTGCESATWMEELEEGKETIIAEIKEIKSMVIEERQEDWEKILAYGSKEFFGGHPADEAFLYYLTAEYGPELMESVAELDELKNPQIWHNAFGKSIHVLWYEYCKATGVQSFEMQNIHEYDCASDDEIVLDFIGDYSVAEGIGTTVYMDNQINGITDCFSDELLTELHSADIFVVNNEFTYTKSNNPIEGKAYTFKANPGRVDLLGELGVDLVCVANNHVFDFHEEGLLDTLETLDDYGMIHIGAGKNIEEASRPAYFIVGGYKIAVVNATQIERSLNYTQEATKTDPGVFKCLKPEAFNKAIKKAKANSDFCIVYVHWGTEGNLNYGPDQEALARGFVESGADAIIGGHTHCLQTVEFMDDVPIYYSLGNFFFSITGAMPEDYATCIAQLRIKDGELGAYFLPCYFSAGQIYLLDADDDRYTDILVGLNNISDTAFIDYSGRLTKQQSEE